MKRGKPAGWNRPLAYPITLGVFTR